MPNLLTAPATPEWAATLTGLAQHYDITQNDYPEPEAKDLAAHAIFKRQKGEESDGSNLGLKRINGLFKDAATFLKRECPDLSPARVASILTLSHRDSPVRETNLSLDSRYQGSSSHISLTSVEGDSYPRLTLRDELDKDTYVERSTNLLLHGEARLSHLDLTFSGPHLEGALNLLGLGKSTPTAEKARVLAYLLYLNYERSFVADLTLHYTDDDGEFSFPRGLSTKEIYVTLERQLARKMDSNFQLTVVSQKSGDVVALIKSHALFKPMLRILLMPGAHDSDLGRKHTPDHPRHREFHVPEIVLLANCIKAGITPRDFLTRLNPDEINRLIALAAQPNVDRIHRDRALKGLRPHARTLAEDILSKKSAPIDLQIIQMTASAIGQSHLRRHRLSIEKWDSLLENIPPRMDDFEAEAERKNGDPGEYNSLVLIARMRHTPQFFPADFLDRFKSESLRKIARFFLQKIPASDLDDDEKLMALGVHAMSGDETYLSVDD